MRACSVACKCPTSLYTTGRRRLLFPEIVCGQNRSGVLRGVGRGTGSRVRWVRCPRSPRGDESRGPVETLWRRRWVGREGRGSGTIFIIVPLDDSAHFGLNHYPRTTDLSHVYQGRNSNSRRLRFSSVRRPLGSPRPSL